MRTCKYEELSAPEFQQAMAETSLVYFTVGSMEFHGRQLPLGMDTIHVHEFCLQAAARTGGVVLPPTYWGACGHEGWPGSLLIRERTLRALVRDVLALLADQGVKLVVVSTGHYPSRQGVTMTELAREAMKKRPETRVLALDPFTAHPENVPCDHAGKVETSLMLALRPELVHMRELEGGEEAFAGIARDAVEATPEYGSKYFNASLDNYVRIVNETVSQL